MHLIHILYQVFKLQDLSRLLKKWPRYLRDNIGLLVSTISLGHVSSSKYKSPHNIMANEKNIKAEAFKESNSVCTVPRMSHREQPELQ